MHLSTAAKMFLPVFLAALSISCSGGSDSNSDTPAITGSDAERSIPFLTKEPDVYTATVEFSSLGRTEQKFIAKKGRMRRIEHRVGTPQQLVVIESDLRYVIDPLRKVYTILDDTAGTEEPEFVRDLTNQLLASREDAQFEKLSDSDGFERYKITLDSRLSSEIIIYVDPNLQMPVKQEYFSVNGNEKAATFSVIFKEVTLTADDSLFEVPSDHKRIDDVLFFRNISDARSGGLR